jgi:hypothetical protein
LGPHANGSAETQAEEPVRWRRPQASELHLRDLGLESIDVVHAGSDSYLLSPKIRALAISKVATELDQRR